MAQPDGMYITETIADLVLTTCSALNEDVGIGEEEWKRRQLI